MSGEKGPAVIKKFKKAEKPVQIRSAQQTCLLHDFCLTLVVTMREGFAEGARAGYNGYARFAG
jgi:hypothetical protein